MSEWSEWLNLIFGCPVWGHIYIFNAIREQEAKRNA
jgi:hypothetical protein